MERVDRLAEALGGSLGEAVRRCADSLLELRQRENGPGRMRRLGLPGCHKNRKCWG